MRSPWVGETGSGARWEAATKPASEETRRYRTRASARGQAASGAPRKSQGVGQAERARTTPTSQPPAAAVPVAVRAHDRSASPAVGRGVICEGKAVVGSVHSSGSTRRGSDPAGRCVGSDPGSFGSTAAGAGERGSQVPMLSPRARIADRVSAPPLYTQGPPASGSISQLGELHGRTQTAQVRKLACTPRMSGCRMKVVSSTLLPAGGGHHVPQTRPA